MEASENRVRAKSDFARCFNPIQRGTSPVTKMPLAPSGKSLAFSRAILPDQEGRLRIRHGRWMQDAMDVLVPPGERRERGRRNRVVLSPRRWGQAC